MCPSDTIAVAAEEVNLRVVVTGSRARERSAITTGSRLGSTQPQVAVGVDRELGVGVAAKGESEPDVLQGGCHAVAAVGQQVGRAGESEPFIGTC